MPIHKIGSTNAGRYATAIAEAATGNENLEEVSLFVRDPERAERCDTLHQAGTSGAYKVNDDYLKGVSLSPKLHFSADLHEVMRDAGLVFVGVPSKHLHSVGELLGRTLEELGADERTIICSLTKGLVFDGDQILTPVEYLQKVIGDKYPLAFLGGGGFDNQIASGLAPKLVAACPAVEVGDRLIQTLNNPRMSVVSCKDRKGAELCGGLKNSYAIAMGIAHGNGYKTTPYAYIFQQAIEEMGQLLEVLGGNVHTLLTPAGIADFDLSTYASPEDIERIKGYISEAVRTHERDVGPLLSERRLLDDQALRHTYSDPGMHRSREELNKQISQTYGCHRASLADLEERMGLPRVGRNMQFGIGLSLGLSPGLIERATQATYEGKNASVAFYELGHSARSCRLPLLTWMVEKVFTGAASATDLMEVVRHQGGGYRVDEVFEKGFGQRPDLRKLVSGESNGLPEDY